MKAFITGGTGCVGANLVSILAAEGIASRILCRPTSRLEALHGLEYETVHGDILDPTETLARAMEGCDWVFHAAASIHCQGPWSWLYHVNVDGSRNIFEAARLAGAQRVVFTSSLSALGVSAPGELLTEESKFNLTPEQFPYGHTKVLAEQEAMRFAEKGLETVIINPASVIGPRDINCHGGAMLIQASQRKLHIYPPGGSSFIGAEELALGHLLAARQGRSGERYIMGSENLSYREVFSLAAEVVGVPPPSIAVPDFVVPVVAGVVSVLRPILGGRIPVDSKQIGMSRRTLYAASDKAVRELGLPQVPVKKSLESAYAWYKQNGFIKQ